MTSKNLIIGVVIVVVVALGVWYIASMSGTGTPSPAASTTEQTGTAASSGTASNTAGGGTLGAIFARGGNFTCTITSNTAAGATSGTIVGSGGKTRLDFNAMAPNGTSASFHVIRSGTTSYTWVDGQQTGIKATIAANTPVVPPSGGVISTDSTVSSDCHPWSPDLTQFTPPKGITFIAQ